ncbi:hypothetical protein MMC11_007610 [Xylographa trunciseda]|nr:hypothetical protein [Xylographa trunciseda]
MQRKNMGDHLSRRLVAPRSPSLLDGARDEAFEANEPEDLENLGVRLGGKRRLERYHPASSSRRSSRQLLRATNRPFGGRQAPSSEEQEGINSSLQPASFQSSSGKDEDGRSAFETNEREILLMKPQVNGPDYSDVSLVIGIDFGTTYSAVAYGLATNQYNLEGRSCRRKIGYYDIMDAKFLSEGSQNTEISTVLTYVGDKANGFKFGPHELEETNATEQETILLAKMLLDPDLVTSNESLKRSSKLIRRLDKRRDPGGGALKLTTNVDVWSDILKWLIRITLLRIIESKKYQPGETSKKNQFLPLPIHFVLCVPASWPLSATNQALTALRGCDRTLLVAPGGKAFFVEHEFDNYPPRFFSLVREPIAATASIFSYQNFRTDTDARLDRVKPGENALVLDIGGGTTDAAFVTRKSVAEGITVDEMVSGDGCCGVIRWNTLFRKLLEEKFMGRWNEIFFGNYTTDMIEQVLNAAQQGFEMLKQCFMEDSMTSIPIHLKKYLRFDLRPVSALGVFRQRIEIPKRLLRTSVIDPVIDEMILLAKKQLGKFAAKYGDEKEVKYLLLVGGPSQNEYLLRKFRSELEDSSFDIGTVQLNQRRAPISVKNDMVVDTKTMNSRGAVLVVGNEMTGIQYLQFNLAVGQDVEWTETDYPGFKICPFQKVELASDSNYSVGCTKATFEDCTWIDRKDAKCGYERMTHCPPNVKHLSIPEDVMISMELHLEETKSIPGYRLIPVRKIGHVWKETIWISYTEETVNGCLINDPANEINSFYEIAFKLENWKELELQGFFEGRTQLYRVEYILDIWKQGPAMKWRITIPKHGEFKAEDSELWAAEATTCETYKFNGDIVSHQSYGKAFPLGSTAIINAARDVA